MIHSRHNTWSNILARNCCHILVLIFFGVQTGNLALRVRENVPVLNGKKIVSLGELYDARHDSFMTPLNLWSSQTIEANKIEAQAEYSKTDFTATEEVLDRLNLIDIDASLKLSFMGGLVKVTGSAKYLHDEQLEENKVRITLSYKSTIRSEKMPYEVPIENKELCQLAHDNKQEYKPTHVVTEVTYGLNGYMLFEKEFKKRDEKRKIAGFLSVVVKSIPSFQVEGSANLKFSENEEKVKKTMSLTFYGDTIIDDPPATFEDAAAVYKMLPSLAKKSNSTVAFTLTPITLYCGKMETLLLAISNENVDKVASMETDFNQVERKIRTQLRSVVATSYPRYNRILSSLQSNFKTFKNEINHEIQTILPKIRGGGAAEQDLTDLIQKYDISPYQKDHICNFLQIRQREIDTITNIIEKKESVPNVVVEDGRSGVGNECIQDNELAVIYTFRALPDDNVAELYATTSAGKWEESQKWFYNRTAVGESGEVLRKFLQFSEDNKDRKVCFLIALEVESIYHKSVQLSVLKSGLEISGDFVPPGVVRELVEQVRGWDDFYLTVKYDPNSFLDEIEAKYWNMDQLESKKNASSQMKDLDSSNPGLVTIHLQGLEPNTMYGVTFTLWSNIGKGPESEEFIILTLPFSPPANLKIANLSSNEVTVNWDESTQVAPNVTITQYDWTISKADDETHEHSRSQTEETSVIIDNLEPAENYVFKVKAVGPNNRQITESGVIINSIPESEWTSTIITTLPERLPSPFLISKSTNTIEIKWDTFTKVAVDLECKNCKVFLLYKVMVKVDGGEKEDISTSLKDQKLISSLEAGVRYEIRVQTVTAKGSSIFSDPLLVTTNPLEQTEIKKLSDSLGLLNFQRMHEVLVNNLKLKADKSYVDNIAEEMNKKKIVISKSVTEKADKPTISSICGDIKIAKLSLSSLSTQVESLKTLSSAITCRIHHRTKFSGHFGSSKVSNENQCMKKCLKSRNCFGVTWDPHFKSGHTCCNCWLMSKGYIVTEEEGFLSYSCRS